jgi:hypothetical protein
VSYGIMDMDLPHGPPHSSTIRTSNGCWTCRLRRKKCDKNQPVCDACAALHITCHYDQDKPPWMDGGVRQEEMAERLKREVKEKAHHRHEERATHGSTSGGRVSVAAEAATGELMVLQVLPKFPRDLARTATICDLLNATPGTGIQNGGVEPCPEASAIWLQRGADCTLTSKDARGSIAFGRSDTILLMFYLEHLLPFLFPFYRPSLLQGGRAWILEMMISSPVVRQATLC